MGWLGLVLVVFTPVRYVTHKQTTCVVITYPGGSRSEGDGPPRGGKTADGRGYVPPGSLPMTSNTTHR